MAHSTESALTKSLRQKCKDRGAFVHKTHGGPVSQGLPDLEGCYRGYYFGFEVKLPGKEKTLTELQKSTLRKIREAGGIGVMVTRWEQIERWFNKIDEVKDG